MKRAISIFVSLLGLSGCYFTAPVDVTQDLVRHTPSAYFDTGKHYFKGPGSSYLEISVSARSVHVVTRNARSTGTDFSRSFSHIAATSRSNWNPEKDFHIAVKKSDKDFSFFTFAWSKSHVDWIKASETDEKVSSLSDLKRRVAAARAAGRVVTYKLMKPNAGAKLRRQDIAHEKAEKAKKGPSGSSTTTKPSVPRTSHLDVGDGVYVKGFFSDELALIVRIDANSGRVKVRRATDYTTKWVSANDVISREESVGRNIGRVVGTGAVIFCILAPDKC